MSELLLLIAVAVLALLLTDNTSTCCCLGNKTDEQEEAVGNDETRLLEMLRSRYHGYGLARPVEQINKTLDVSLLCVINEFLGIDELTGTIKVTASITAGWQDDQLRWNPARFENLTAMPMRTRDIFLPTIVKDGNGGTQSSLFTSGNGQNDRDINSMVWVKHTGEVEALVTGTYVSSCKLNLNDFPFDSHHCTFTFKVWRFNEHRMRLLLDGEQKASELSMPDSSGKKSSTIINVNANSNWLMESIISQSVTIEEQGVRNLSAIIYTITCRRRTDYYLWNVIAPTLGMLVLMFATFFMPFGPERCMFTITLVLTSNIFQQALSSKLPVTAKVIPYVRQVTVQVLLTIFVTIESCFVVWIANKHERSTVPDFVRKLVPKLRRRMKITLNEKPSLPKRPLFVEQSANFISHTVPSSSSDLTEMFPEQAYNGSLPNLMLELKAQNQNNDEKIASLIAQREQQKEIWQKFGDWQEVAQFVDFIALICVNACVFLMPLFFYSHRLVI